MYPLLVDSCFSAHAYLPSRLCYRYKFPIAVGQAQSSTRETIHRNESCDDIVNKSPSCCFANLKWEPQNTPFSNTPPTNVMTTMNLPTVGSGLPSHLKSRNKCQTFMTNPYQNKPSPYEISMCSVRNIKSRECYFSPQEALCVHSHTQIIKQDGRKPHRYHPYICRGASRH